MEIEQKKFEIVKQNSEIEQRYNNIKYKESYLKDKYDDYQRIKDFVEMKEKQNAQYEKDLKKAGYRVQESIKEIIMKENMIEKEKINLNKIMHEVNEQGKMIENNKMDIEHKKAELNLRYQFLNTFSYKNPIMNEDFFEQNQNYMTMNTHAGSGNGKFKNIDNNNFNPDTYNYKKENGNGYINNNYEQFNAEKYFNNVKNRIENGKRLLYEDYKPNNDKFDIAKEKEYIRKNKDFLDNRNKKY